VTTMETHGRTSAKGLVCAMIANLPCPSLRTNDQSGASHPTNARMSSA
jgi:hypothetical protein